LWFDFATAANEGIDVFSEDFMSNYTDKFDEKFLEKIATEVTSRVNTREETDLSKDVIKQSIPFMSSDFSDLLNSDKLSNAVTDFLFKSTSLTQYKRESELSNKSYDDLVSALAALTN
jgi:hypothetical protein